MTNVGDFEVEMEIDLGATTGGKDFGNVGGVCDAEIARGAGAGLCDTTV